MRKESNGLLASVNLNHRPTASADTGDKSQANVAYEGVCVCVCGGNNETTQVKERRTQVEDINQAMNQAIRKKSENSSDN